MSYTYICRLYSTYTLQIITGYTSDWISKNNPPKNQPAQPFCQPFCLQTSFDIKNQKSIKFISFQYKNSTYCYCRQLAEIQRYENCVGIASSCIMEVLGTFFRGRFQYVSLSKVFVDRVKRLLTTSVSFLTDRVTFYSESA